MMGKKKGNVDSDIIFHTMKKLYKKEDFTKIVLVSGDGDYKLLVDFLIEENRFEKILFPDRKRASSLYKRKGFLRQLTVRIPFRRNSCIIADEKNVNFFMKIL